MCWLLWLLIAGHSWHSLWHFLDPFWRQLSKRLHLPCLGDCCLGETTEILMRYVIFFFLFWKVSEHRARLYPIYPLQTLTLSPASFGKHFRPRMIPGDTSVVSARQVDDGSRGHVIDHKDMECERETETGKETKRGRLQWSVRGTEAQQGSILINERHFSKETLDCIVQDLFIDVTSERSVWVFVRAEVAFSVLLGTEQDE